ncbi:HalOD1 output domain-containing protein [Halomicrobium salinisoli]|uniref:HalOD1 output domain-containing protein n=1 Tax=Halomicrobium salinisoli TaxID=2878391 RepID=UPI001CF0AFFA|nr:HalOD1 output domain-containing protein [Halomicrobium salinisoli]
MESTTIDTAGLCSDIVTAIAERTGADPLEMDPLYDAVDVDAVKAIVGSAGDASVEFAYHGHTVVVDGDGSVTVTGEAEPEMAGVE